MFELNSHKPPGIPYASAKEWTGPGWWFLLYRIYTAVEKENAHIVTSSYCSDDNYVVYVTDVKEKYGYLTVYLSSCSPELLDLVDSCTVQSGTICESCGNPGVLRTTGWWRTRCRVCEIIEDYARGKQ